MRHQSATNRPLLVSICLSTVVLFGCPVLLAQNVLQLEIKGVVTNAFGKPVSGAVVVPWSRYGFLDERGKTDDEGNYELHFRDNQQIDAFLINHSDYHINVLGYSKSRRGKDTINATLYSIDETQIPDDVSAPLRSTYIMGEYDEAATLTSMVSETNRRQVTGELFEKMKIDERLGRLMIPNEKSNELLADILKNRKYRILETYKQIQTARPVNNKSFRDFDQRVRPFEQDSKLPKKK